ncbi:GIY-YIG nuclease family protein [Halobacillus salinus]|uniref:GIY-YIG nuclease family protein n=1 Tax=Halobacillus salinus TaxID=192814 RepID=A0A4Z0GTU0_9BACI|nr:GIY-YIG nuclease family protein [Halobacillus salinus]TGB00833.1 GIY-YIG nuclease family protein [Halobacillus salinus]
MADEHYVYMLRCKDNTFYTGYTNDFENRLKMHESGKGAKYTRGRGPFVIELVQTFETKREAMQTEYRIKRLSRTQKERYVKEQGGF